MNSIPAPPPKRGWFTSLRRSEAPFLAALGCIGGLYVLLIVAMLVADASFTSPGHLLGALASREIRYATWLSLITCSITTILSLWVAVPTGYILSRYRQEATGPLARTTRHVLDAILDIPIVLPPLVIGLSLLILFQTPPGRWIEHQVQHNMGDIVAWGAIPLLILVVVAIIVRVIDLIRGNSSSTGARWLIPLSLSVAYLLVIELAGWSNPLRSGLQRRLGTPITYAVPSVIIAQFAVAAAFAVRTMRITFDQINPRSEQVAMTLGCTRAQAFFMVTLPEARRGILTAATMAWARSLGEFGPILVFSGATRMRTEVLPTTVFLELSIGNIEAAVAVSLLMVACAVAVLVIIRGVGTGDPLSGAA